MDEPKLRPQFKLFAINYVGRCQGNAEKSALAAGYSKTYARGNAHKLLKRADICNYIDWLRSQNGQVKRCIMDLDELREFWSDTVKDGKLPMKDRLRASEYLGKSIGAFGDAW